MPLLGTSALLSAFFTVAASVCLKSILYDEFLLSDNLATHKYDASRRHLTTLPDHKLDRASNKNWRIVAEGGHYQIINGDTDEHLYAAASDLKYDNDRRQVFLWTEPWNDPADQQGLWDIEVEDGNAEVYIKNVRFGEYLYAAVDGFNFPNNGSRRVFTWFVGKKDEEKDYGVGRAGLWKIIGNCYNRKS